MHSRCRVCVQSCKLCTSSSAPRVGTCLATIGSRDTPPQTWGLGHAVIPTHVRGIPPSRQVTHERALATLRQLVVRMVTCTAAFTPLQLWKVSEAGRAKGTSIHAYTSTVIRIYVHAHIVSYVCTFIRSCIWGSLPGLGLLALVQRRHFIRGTVLP